MKNAIYRFVAIGGLGLFPGLNSQGLGMEEQTIDTPPINQILDEQVDTDESQSPGSDSEADSDFEWLFKVANEATGDPRLDYADYHYDKERDLFYFTQPEYFSQLPVMSDAEKISNMLEIGVKPKEAQARLKAQAIYDARQTQKKEAALHSSIQLNEEEEKSETILRGGPPRKPPVFGERIKIYDENTEIKIDEDGRAYIGLSLKELREQELLEHQPKIVRNDEFGFIFELEGTKSTSQEFEEDSPEIINEDLKKLFESYKYTPQILDEDRGLYFRVRLKNSDSFSEEDFIQELLEGGPRVDFTDYLYDAKNKRYYLTHNQFPEKSDAEKIEHMMMLGANRKEAQVRLKVQTLRDSQIPLGKENDLQNVSPDNSVEDSSSESEDSYAKHRVDLNEASKNYTDGPLIYDAENDQFYFKRSFKIPESDLK